MTGRGIERTQAPNHATDHGDRLEWREASYGIHNETTDKNRSKEHE